MAAANGRDIRIFEQLPGGGGIVPLCSGRQVCDGLPYDSEIEVSESLLDKSGRARDEIIESPAHPYTRMLLSAVASTDPAVERAKERRAVSGEAPDVTNPPVGCRFMGRCPKYQSELDDEQRQRCRDVLPPLESAAAGVTKVACHFPY